MSTEVLALVGTIVTLVGGGVGFFTKWALGQADKRVEAAERWLSEEKALRKEDRDVQNKRLDEAIVLLHAQNALIVDLTSGLKLLGDGHRDEMRKANDGITTLLARNTRTGSHA